MFCCCCSVSQSCPTLCDPVDCSMPGLPDPHCLLKFVQVHVHCFVHAIQPSHPLTPSSPSVLNLSQHQGLSQWVVFSYQMTKILEASASASVLPMSIQGWFPFRLTGLISLLSKGLSRLFSSTSVWKHQFFSALYGPTLTSVHDYWKNHSFDYTDLCRASDVHILTLQKKKPACIEDPFNEKKIL